MRKIYLDANFICHPEYSEGRTTVETDMLDNVCDAALTCYIFVPSEMTYETESHQIHGPFIQSIDSARAESIQAQYEKDMAEIALLQEQNAQYEAALAASIPISDLDAAYQEGVNSAYDT